MTPVPNGSDIAATLRQFAAEARTASYQSTRYRCRYVEWGSGPPLVFLHGLSDRARSFALVMARLSDRFRCVSVELANGLDDGAKFATYRHHDHALDVIGLLDHLGHDRVDLVGSSFGSTVALRILAEYPHRVRRCVLQGGFACRPLRWYERIPATLTRSWPGRIGDVPGRRLVLSRLDRPQFAAAPPEAYRFFRECTGSTPIRALTLRALLLDRFDFRIRLPGIPHPILLLGGDGDQIVPRSCEAELEAGLPDVRRVEFARCGHYPQYTHPGEMAKAIRAFLLP